MISPALENGGTNPDPDLGFKATIHTRASTPASKNMEKEAGYCDLSPQHTMCMYEGPSKECEKKTVFREMSQNAKDMMLKKHNDQRRRVAKGLVEGQPPAADMMEVTWDEELERIAQRWADQCMYKHDFKGNTKLDGSHMGQNLYLGESSFIYEKQDFEDEIEFVFEAWSAEGLRNGSDLIDLLENFQFPEDVDFKIGHYTQTIWSRNSRIGCANIFWKEEKKRKSYQNMIVCNYSKGGNIPGEKVYTQGAACSSCPPHTSCKDSLCVT